MAEDKPKPAADLTGGPGLDPEPKQPEPKLVTVKHGGRELQVPEDVATAWSDREREFDQRFSRQGQELGELRKRATSEPKPEPKTAEPDLNTLWFEDPSRAAKIIEERTYERVAGEYRQQEALKSFWDGFYRGNTDLQDDGWIARAMLNEHATELVDLPVRQAQEKLAEFTRKEILRIAGKTKAQDRPTPALLEPASGDRPPRSRRDEDEGPQSISDHIRQRNDARRRGAKGAA
jgi:hypothetical protein